MNQSRRRRMLLPLAAMLVAAAGLTACGSDSKDTTKTSTDSSSSTSSSAPAGAVVIKTVDISDLGTVLTDAEGKVVYTLTNNGAAVDCTGACLAAWPPVLLPAGTETATGAEDLGVVTITEGKQVTSGGLPLYTFSGDATAGVANGEALASFGGTWHVVKASGGAGTGAGSSSSTTETTDTTDDGGYNY